MTHRPIESISADEWIRYRWIEVTTWTDRSRMFAQGYLRDPDESAKAKTDVESVGWDVLRAWIAGIRSGGTA